MKIQIKNYTFDKTAKTVTFNDYTSIDLDSILLITNVTSNKIIYNFAASGGTVFNNVLTLNYDTSNMNNTDKLQIFYEDGQTSTDVINTTVDTFDNEVLWELRRMVKLMESSGTVDAQNRQKMTIDTTVAVLPSSYYAGANQWNIPNSTVFAPLNNSSVTYVQPVQTGPVDPRWAIIDQARLVSEQGIRNHLSFS